MDGELAELNDFSQDDDLYNPLQPIYNDFDVNWGLNDNNNRRAVEDHEQDEEDEDIDEENKELKLKNDDPISDLPLNYDPNLFPEKVSEIERKIAENKYDIESWTILVTEAQKLPIDKARGIYERFFQVFPTAGKFWKQYVEHEMNAKNYANVEAILGRCLLKCLHIELWRTYIQFVKLIKKDAANGLIDIKKAYEFAIEKVGYDINSTQLWMDYIQFLSEMPSANEREKSSRMDEMRHYYTRAVEIPMHNIEAIWKDYDSFENNRDKLLAKSLIPKLSPKYMTARSVYRERKTITDNLLRNMLAAPPGKGIISFEKKQVSLWKKLIQSEKANAQRLDPPLLRLRVDFTFKQCLLCLLHYPEIWYDYANFYIEQNLFDQAIEIYEQALNTLPDCTLIYFAYCDFLESQNNFSAARKIYEKLIEKKPSSLAYIQMIQFSRRAENIKQARKEFLNARKNDKNCTYHVYISAAMMEYYSNQSESAKNIFEKGIDEFIHQPEYVITYLKFLWNINEEHNARSLFERVLSSNLPAEKTRDIWNLFLEFEYNYSNLSSISRVEKRKANAFPGEDKNGILALVHRHKYLDLWPCDLSVLESFGKDEELSEELKEKERLQLEANKSNLAKLARPDLSSMVQYRPESMSNLAPSSLGLVPPPKANRETPVILPFNSANIGHGFGNIPDCISNFIALLPTPDKYKGPPINVDSFMMFLQTLQLPNLPNAPAAPPANTSNLGKRNDPPSDYDKEDNKKSKPSNNIWRSRQKAMAGKGGKFNK